MSRKSGRLPLNRLRMWYGDSNLDLNTWLQDVQGSDMHIPEFWAEWSECYVVKRQAGDLPSFP